MKGVRILRARKLHVSPIRDTRVYMQVDGEYAGHLPGSIEIVSDAITLLLPPLYKRRVYSLPRPKMGEADASSGG
jgi:diacylglycerol kinase family enzyme